MELLERLGGRQLAEVAGGPLDARRERVDIPTQLVERPQHPPERASRRGDISPRRHP
jgi:hypothetical protein